MNLEAPADAWYVWVGVVLVSLSVAGVVLELPSEPPPDAAGAANTVDRVAASEHGTSAGYKLDAEQTRIGTKQLAFRNGGGTTHASVAFGSMTPVDAATGPTSHAGDALLAGESVGTVIERHTEFSREQQLREAFVNLRTTVDREGAAWHETNGRLRVRSVRIAGEVVVLVGT
jgi:hypothetical protein